MTSKDVAPQGTLGVLAGMSVISGCMIGAGVFVVGSSLFNELGNSLAVFLVWVVCGFVAICGGLSWAEWALMIPESGGDIPYLDHTFGRPERFFSFNYTFARTFVANPICCSSLATVCATLVMKIFFVSEYNIMDNYKNNNLGIWNSNLWLAFFSHFFLSWIFLFVGFLMIAFSDIIIIKSNVSLTLLKMLTILLLIFAPAFWHSNVDPMNAWSTLSSDKTNYSNLPQAFLLGFFCYDGFANLSTIVSDLINPARDTLRCILLGVVSVAGLYIVLNACFMAVLSTAVMKSSKFNLSEEYITKLTGSTSTGYVIMTLIMISAFGAMIGISFAASRITLVASQRGRYLVKPDFFSKISNKWKTPFNAICVHFAISAALTPLTLLYKISDKLFSSAMYCNWIFYTLTSIALIRLRFTEPDRKRPFKVFIVCPIIVVLCGVFMLVAPLWTAISTGEFPYEIVIGCAAISIGSALYYFS